MRARWTFRTLLVFFPAALVLTGCSNPRQNIDTSLNDVSPAAGFSRPTSTVYFAFGSAHLTTEARRAIRAVAATVTASDVSNVQVTGHADTPGSADGNERLSQRRAQAVAAALAANGVARDRIVVDWTGERAPPIPTVDNTPEAANRVVTIKL
jgi:outer membrane protein OmpA-like peptidoglycan-associated protein